MMNAALEKNRTQRLIEYLWKNQHRHFRYTVHDCFSFTAKWIDSELGTSYFYDIGRLLEGKGLAKVVHRIRNPGEYARTVQEIINVQPQFAQPWEPGDFCIFATSGHETLGLLSRRMVHAPGETSLLSVDASSVICHWSLTCLKH